ncbi:hypothetical protein [Opitutus sp. GAS368]|uniref:hypothetical protein n=1 Tax=Opitutus sp. GAS368 TaxID=1882749 RepID=UPI00087BFEB0|nr:hypothetical protein [Opitutus sp. GAS368]SDR84968.1 hypothetical protein SAMN05444173_1102 [Opitutus sp. GAS368]
MKRILSLFFLCGALAGPARAQPSTTGPMPAPVTDFATDARRTAYLARANEVLQWYVDSIKPGDPATFGSGQIAAKLARHEDAATVSARVIELMSGPQSQDMFWMFPWTAISFLGRDQLSPAAKAAIRDAWRTYFPMRGDTENHWAMYYTSLYLMTELHPGEPAASWFNGKSSAENNAEARAYLIHWMDLATTIGQGEFNPTHYIGEYAIPMLYLATWARDPEMKIRGHMKLDWLLADLAENTLNGVLRGPNARTDDTSVIQRWMALSSYFSWQCFGNTPPPAGYGGFGIWFAAAAANYEVPEVIFRLANDRSEDYLQHDLKRSRRRWRYSDVLMAPVYKTNYMRHDYAVGSYQGGLVDPIQTHVWDVTWAVPDPRGVHNTMFSAHPYASARVMQTYFTELPDHMLELLASQGKPSYDVPDKILGGSPYEHVFQDLDTVIALYDIPEGTRFPRINGFFSKDLVNVTEDKSGWIFAQGGNTYLAYRPLAPFHWEHLLGYKSLPSPSGYKWERVDLGEKGDKLLVSPHLKNGTIVQAASASEFKSFDAFKAAVVALPLEFKLEPVPTVRLKSLRGHEIVCTFGQAPQVDGRQIDYTKWKLFEGPHLNAGKGSRKLTITEGKLERVLDFNTLTITDRVKP